MRLIDADAFAEFLKDAIKQQKYEDTKIDGLLTVADVIEAVITELDGTSFIGFKNAPTIEPQRTGQWIPCGERLPDRIINSDVETVQEFFVTVKERWPGEEWKYHTDVAEFPGDYIDDVWQTYNDWKEGQDVHVIAWMPLPESFKPDDFSQHMNPPED